MKLISMQTLPYHSGLSRRQTLKWLGVISATATLPVISGCESLAISAAKVAGDWPELDLEPITAEGYGTDPNLISPPDAPWPLTMTPAQRDIAAVLCDILIPREGAIPSASEVGVPDLLDEWVSAPYEEQQSDRGNILAGLAWLDQESTRRFGTIFVEASPAQRLQIIDDIAHEEAESKLRYAYIARVFDGIRTLVSIAFFASPEGTGDMGYLGNTPITGDYPGPTAEAMAHLDATLAELGLSEYAYPLEN